MTVREMIDSYVHINNPDLKFKIILGKSSKILYSGNGFTFMCDEVAKMKVWKWMIDGKRNPVFVIIAEPEAVKGETE